MAIAVEGAVEQALEGIASDVGGEEIHGVFEGVGQMGFTIPDIERAGGDEMMVEGALEGVGIHDFTTGGVDEPGAGFEFLEEAAISKTAGGEGAAVFKRDMQGDDIGMGQNFGQREVIGAIGLQGQRRVVAQYVQAKQACFFSNAATDVAAANDAEGAAGEQRGAAARQQRQHGGDIFGDGVGVAAGGGGPANVGIVEPGDVEVVGAGGGGGDKADGGVGKQFGVDGGFGPDDERIGRDEMGAGDFAVGNQGEVAEGAKGFAGLRDAGGTNDVHGGRRALQRGPVETGKRATSGGTERHLRAVILGARAGIPR